MGTKYKEGLKETKAAPKKTGEPAPKRTKFEFPSNVRQVGGLNKGIKIYIEDYAYTYILKLCSKNGKKETAAFLVGFMTTELGEDILVISAAISPPFSSPPQDGQVFSESDRRYAEGIIDKYFCGLEIVGWARLQPGFGLYLSASDISSHYLGFTDKHSVLFLCDPEEKLNCFYAWNEGQDDLVEVQGYFIYYDKNHEMNVYISDLKKRKKRSPESVIIDEGGVIEEIEAVEVVCEEEMRDDDDALSRSVSKAKRIADVQRQKRIISMMTSVSALLFFACVIMVIGLLQSGERIAKVEAQMKELRTGYNSIVARINDAASPAFAAQPEQREADAAMGEKYVIEQVNSYAQAGSGTGFELEEAIGIDAESRPEAQTQTEQPERTAESAQASVEAAASPTVYIVQQGDTLTLISQKFYGTTSNIGAIMDANGMTDPDKLAAGSRLVIP